MLDAAVGLGVRPAAVFSLFDKLPHTLLFCLCLHYLLQEQQGDLKAAQMAKLDAVIAAADLQPSDHVLEIGCGWGSFAMRAASTRGCRCAAGAAAGQMDRPASARQVGNS